MITISGTTIKTPSDYTLGYKDIDKAWRNTNGLMRLEFIAQKRKIEMKWKFLTSTEAELIRSLAKNAVTRFVTVTYPEADGSIESGTFYAGDLDLKAFDYVGSVIRYRDVSLNMIMQ